MSAAGRLAQACPFGLKPSDPSTKVAGPVRPARHYGSVDVFFEAMDVANPGDVLVIDSGGRTDEGCVGDLTVIEAMSADCAGIVVWGLHRDGSELRQLALPVFTYGTCPAGPQRVDEREAVARESARFGEHAVTREDTTSIWKDMSGRSAALTNAAGSSGSQAASCLTPCWIRA